MRLDKTGWKMTVSHALALSPVTTKLPSDLTAESVRTIEQDLADNGVAAPAGVDQTGLAKLTAEARAHGIELDVVVVKGNPEQDSQLRDLASEIGKTHHGTIAVFSDDWIGTSSDSISRVRLEWAEDRAKFTGGKYEKAATIFTHRLEQPQTVSWTGLTAVILVLIAAVVGGLYWVKSRRRNTAAAPTDRQPTPSGCGAGSDYLE